MASGRVSGLWPARSAVCSLRAVFNVLNDASEGGRGKALHELDYRSVCFGHRIMIQSLEGDVMSAGRLHMEMDGCVCCRQ